MRKTVLFDLDDTLYSELDFVKSGYLAVSERITEKYSDRGLDKDGVFDRLWELFQEDARGVFNRFLNLQRLPCEEGDIRELVKLYREHTPSIKPFSDAVSTLKQLKDMRCNLGVLSDGYPISQRNKLAALFSGKGYLFDKILLTDELGKEYHKPDERAFIMLMEFFQTDWNETIYVGDNPGKDFYIGNEHPILTIRLLREDGVYKNSEYLKDIREKLTIGALSELPDIVKRS